MLHQTPDSDCGAKIKRRKTSEARLDFLGSDSVVGWRRMGVHETR
jgi:hypothetical protein